MQSTDAYSSSPHKCWALLRANLPLWRASADVIAMAKNVQVAGERVTPASETERSIASSPISTRSGAPGISIGSRKGGRASPIKRAKSERQISFDLDLQSRLADLVNSLEHTQSELQRYLSALSAARKKSSNLQLPMRQDSVSEKQTTRTTSSVKLDADIQSEETGMQRLVENLTQSQASCQSAANSLLRRGSCSKDVTWLQRGFDECEKLLEHTSLTSHPAACSGFPSPRSQARLLLHRPSTPVPSAVEADESEDSSSGGEDEITKYNSIRSRGKQIAARVGSRKGT